MKKFTVSVQVWHGEYRHTETATHKSVESALATICKTSMGICYCPKIGSTEFNTAVSLLKLKGWHKWGWGDYILNITEDCQATCPQEINA